MKKVRFEFNNSFETPITEVFEFEEGATETEIEKVFEEWYFNELDRAGIEGCYEEIEE